MSPITTLFNFILEILGNAIRRGTKNKFIGKEEIKLLTDDNDDLCRKFRRINKKKLLVLIRNYSKIAGYNITIQNSTDFLYQQ